LGAPRWKTRRNLAVFLGPEECYVQEEKARRSGGVGGSSVLEREALRTGMSVSTKDGE